MKTNTTISKSFLTNLFPLLICFVLFFTNCNRQNPQTASTSTGSDSLSTAVNPTAKVVFTPIVFNGTVKEGSTLQPGVPLRLFDKDGAELTGGATASQTSGAFSISVPAAANPPYLLIADNGNKYFLEALIVPAVQTGSNNNLDLTLHKYSTFPSVDAPHDLAVGLYNSTGMLSNKQVSYSTETASNSENGTTGSAGQPALFHSVSATGNNCKIYLTGTPESPLITFPLNKLIRKAKINVNVTSLSLE